MKSLWCPFRDQPCTVPLLNDQRRPSLMIEKQFKQCLLLQVTTALLGAFHLVKISGISGSAVNGTRFVGSSHWKIPRKSGNSKKVVPFSRLEFPNGMSCSIDVSCSLYQFQVHRRAPGHVPGFTTKWNNFLPIGNSTFATTEISGFFS